MEMKYKQCGILYVDDEIKSLKYFKKAYENDFTIFTADSASAGWEIIKENSRKICVLLTDQKMPKETGVQLLEKVQNELPGIIRILVTAYSDIDSAIAAVNKGAIYKYINKPWDIRDLKITLMRAMDFYIIQKERDQLVSEKMSVIQRMYLANHEKNFASLALGMSLTMHNSLFAISQFIEKIPIQPSENSDKISYWKHIEKLLISESQHIYYITKSLKKITDNSGSDFGVPESINYTMAPLQNKNIFSAGENINLNINIEDPIQDLQVNSELIVKLFTTLALICKTVSDAKNEHTEVQIIAKEVITSSNQSVIDITVNDNHQDWTKDQWDRLYSPFSPSKNYSANTGLDLLVCYLIVSHHSGIFTISGTKSEKFNIQLPMNPLSSILMPIKSEEKLLNKLFSNHQNWF